MQYSLSKSNKIYKLQGQQYGPSQKLLRINDWENKKKGRGLGVGGLQTHLFFRTPSLSRESQIRYDCETYLIGQNPISKNNAMGKGSQS